MGTEAGARMVYQRSVASMLMVALLTAADACGPQPPAKGPGAKGKATACKADPDCSGGLVCFESKCQKPVFRDIAGGDVSLAAVYAAAGMPKCVRMPGMPAVLDKLRTDDAFRASFPEQLARKTPAKLKPMHAYGLWLSSTSVWLRRCGVERDLRELADGAYVSEKNVEWMLKERHCIRLGDLENLGMWPFQQRFAREVVRQDYAAAEVTRRVWLKVIDSIDRECKARMDTRSYTALETRREKLESVVGLDDELLIGLRRKLLEAMDAGDAETAGTYARSVSDRENVLDQRNAARHEARQRALQASVQKQAESRKASQAAKPASYQDTLKDVKDTVETARDAARATKEIMGLFGL